MSNSNKGSIRLHPEHGVNPTLCVCFFCRQETGELALLGASIPGEAPRRAVVSYDPCDKCAKLFARGNLMVEAETTRTIEGQPSLIDGKDYYPTGRYCVVSDNFIEDFVDDPEAKADVLKHHKCVLSKAPFEELVKLIETLQARQALADAPTQGNA